MSRGVEFRALRLDLMNIGALRHRGHDPRVNESVEAIPPSADQVCTWRSDEQPMLRMHDSGDLARVRRGRAAPSPA